MEPVNVKDLKSWSVEVSREMREKLKKEKRMVYIQELFEKSNLTVGVWSLSRGERGGCSPWC